MASEQSTTMHNKLNSCAAAILKNLPSDRLTGSNIPILVSGTWVAVYKTVHIPSRAWPIAHLSDCCDCEADCECYRLSTE